MIELRPYQNDQVNAVEEAWRAGVRSTLIEAATGSGKTTSFSAVAARAVARGERVLVLAHRRELVDQAAARLRTFGLRVGIERGGCHAGNAPVVVTSVQTMSRRMMQWNPSAFQMIVVDEAHHCPSASYRGVLAYFRTARVLGVTATPDRADQVALRTVFQTCAHRYDVTSAVGAGFLVPVRGIRVEVPGMDLSTVRRRSRKTSALAGGAPEDAPTFSDLHPGDLGKAMIAPAVVEGVTGPLLELAGTRRTVVFAVDRAHAKAIADSLNARREGCAMDVHGAMRPRDRAEVLRLHRAGAYQFLVNVLVLTEGYDDPTIACVALARPTQSRVFVAQACGRGLRPAPGKTEALVIDFTTNTSRFTLIGPADVLAGAMILPPVSDSRRSKPAELAPYVAGGYAARFKTWVVELLRRAGTQVKVVAWRRPRKFWARVARWFGR